MSSIAAALQALIAPFSPLRRARETATETAAAASPSAATAVATGATETALPAAASPAAAAAGGMNFIFLVVGHTKNAADRLFNSLKHEYRKKNLYTMEDLITSLDVSDCVTVVPTVPEDFMNYDAFFKDLFRDLACKVKQNHIFACSENDRMSLRESNMNEHKIGNHKCSKKGRYMSAAD